jgi:DNA-binding NarL/FixJ family response regulator
MGESFGPGVRQAPHALRRRRARVLLVDDGTVVPGGCRAALEREPRLLVDAPGDPCGLGTRGAGSEPGVVVLAMDACDVPAVREAAAMAPVLVVSKRRDAGFVRRTLEAGARGFVLHDDSHLGSAVRDVADGGAYFSPEVANWLREGYLEGPVLPIDGVLARLDETERAVLRCLVDGLSTEVIALRLQTSPDAIDAHRRRILDVLAPARGRGCMR